MSTHLYLVLFVVMAIAMNIVVYIGVTMVYVSEKRRGKASRASDDPATHAAACGPAIVGTATRNRRRPQSGDQPYGS